MTILGLAMAGAVLPADDRPIILKRWVVRTIGAALVPVVLAVCGFAYRDDQRISKLENAPASAQAIALQEQRLEAIEKVIQMYEGPNGLRVQRAQEVSELKTRVEVVSKAVDHANDKLDRLLERGR